MATDVKKPASGARAGQQTTTATVNKPEKNSYNVPVLLTVVMGLIALAAGIVTYPGEIDSLLALVNLKKGGAERLAANVSSATSADGEKASPPAARTNIAVPSAQLIEDGMGARGKGELAFYRPRVLTDSVVPPTTPPHGPEKLGLFLFRNGFSTEPVTALVPRDRLCKSRDTIAGVLSSRAGEHFGCDGACRVFLANGWEVTSCDELVNDDKVWLVPPRREFMWPTFERGHKVEVWHVETANQRPIVVETLSDKPKLFHLHNFFSEGEADQLIANALKISEPSNRLKRSTTGQGPEAHQDTHRTSENAWDMTSPTAQRLKRRCFELLGIRPYNDEWADGLQILRYNMSQAYNSHLDYLDAKPHTRLDSANGGVNRYATIIVYLTDVEEGGETVFPTAPSMQPNPPSEEDVRKEVRERQLAEMGIKQDSWEERLVVQCRTKLAFKPSKAAAVLFYSQHPDGRQDEDSLHGACPVIKGIKWAANLWTWTGPVHGNDFDTVQPQRPKDPQQLVAQFSSAVGGLSLYWRDQFFGRMEPNVPIRMNTFEGHEFNIYEGDDQKQGRKIMTYIIGRNTGEEQHFHYDP